MDVFFIQAIVAELADRIAGSRVDKVFQPGPDTIIFNLWTGKEKLRLAASFRPDGPGLFLTESKVTNPPAPHRFAQLLRSRLARLLAIGQLSGERVVEMEFAGRDRQAYRLFAEFTGRNLNLVLAAGDGNIVDCLKRRDTDAWNRRLKPGQRYRPPMPPSGKHPLGEITAIPAAAAEDAHAFRTWLRKQVHPMSPAAAQALADQVEKGADPEAMLRHFGEAFIRGTLRPAIVRTGNRGHLTALPGTFFSPDDSGLVSSPSALVEQVFAETSGGVVGDLGKRRLEAAIQKRKRQLEGRLRKLEEDRDRQKRWFDEGRWGELILAGPPQVERGRTEATVTDWYVDPPRPVTVPLDPALTPRENAVRYLRRKARSERGLTHVAQRQAATREEIDWLESVAFSLEEADQPEELRQIEWELEKAGLPVGLPSIKPRKPLPPASPQINRAGTPGGFVVLWGKNNRENDYLSRHILKAGDLWFHAHGMPGAHLVLKVEKGRIVPEADILFAAGIAAGYSRGRADSKVEVMVALGKEVNKPKGAPPGLVTVGSYRTVRVPPLRPKSEST